MIKHSLFKALLPLLSGMLAWCSISAQNIGMLQADSLHQELLRAQHDTSRALIMTQLAEAYRAGLNDSTLLYAMEALEIARRYHSASVESKALSSICHYFWNRGNLPEGLDAGLKALRIARENGLRYDQAFAMIRVGNVYLAMKDYKEAIRYFEDTRRLVEHTPDSFFYAVTFWVSADAYSRMNRMDSALYMARRAYDTASKMNNPLILSQLPRILGNIYANMGDQQRAYQYFLESLEASVKRKDYAAVASGYRSLASFHRSMRRYDSAIWYARMAYEQANFRHVPGIALDAAGLLSQLYDTIDARTSLQYLRIANSIRDSLYSTDRLRAAQALSFAEKERQNELNMAEAAYRSKARQVALLSGMAMLLLVSMVLYRNIRTKQKANKDLREQKEKVEEALTRLKSTQSQLIQSEKMASLGELTAGIAHEIQNPLNFVNNFSEINMELSDEILEAASKADLDEVRTLAADIKSNQEKINEHGKRADGIVKSMLQHSRTDSGQKELTDINALANEYLRLAFHGMRGKDKSFNASMQTAFDPAMEKIPIVPQEIGRVLLNLINNAFYAVQQKSKISAPGYQPVVTVSTHIVHAESDHPNSANAPMRNFVSIQIADNGLGIPENIKAKIFQPFFTTKPTGQGTGLGLSLSYDIVKAHGGELKVETMEGEGTGFTVLFPI
jgi:signal transduction histidine kinase